MLTRIQQRPWLCMALLALGVVGSVWAQAPQGNADAQAQAPALAAGAPADGAAGARDGVTAIFLAADLASTDDIGVRAVLTSPGKSPSEMAESVQLLISLKRPDLARRLLQALLARQLDASELLALAEALGTGEFTDMATCRAVAPEGKQLADAVLGAVASRVRDPNRIAQWIRELGDPTPATRHRALVRLCESQGYAAGPMVAVLADPKRVAEYGAVRAVLAAMGIDAIRPLTSTLDASNPNLVVEALGALADLPREEVVPFVLASAVRADVAPEVRAAAVRAIRKQGGVVPSRAAAARRLAEQAVAYFDGKIPLREEEPGRVALWAWDEGKGQPAPRTRSVEEAQRLLALRFARDAFAVSPEDRSTLLLYLTVLLDEASYRRETDPAAAASAEATLARIAEFEPIVIEAVLDRAMRTDHPLAGIAAARILGRQPQAVRLLVRTSTPSALVVATRHADRRFRLAALETLVRMRPTGDYPGANYVPEALAFFAASTGVRRAVVVGAIEGQAGRVAGYLGGMGYEIQRAVDGRALLLEALRSPDCELVMVDAGVDHPTIEFLMQQLRRDGRTALLPVGILARPDLLDKAKRTATDDGRAESFAYPYDAQTAQWQVDRVLRQAGKGVGPVAERRQQAATALDWLAQLAGDASQRYYDLRPAHASVLQAANVPELTLRAVAVLVHFGTGESQRTLVELATRDTVPMPTRVAAMGGFHQSVERHGLLLTSVGQRAVLDVLAVAELSVPAATLAADFGTPESQAALVEFAARDTASPVARLAAVEGLRRSLVQYGMMLSYGRIHDQYKQMERFNQSGNKDVATRHVLRRILDCIEAPAQSVPPVDRDAKP